MSTERCEIGGYIELETFSGEPYHKDVIALNCGRDCFEYLLELRKPTAVWMPAWMCDCQFQVCERMDVSVKWYEVGLDMRPIYDFEVAPGEYLYLVDYYGQLNFEDIERARQVSSRCLFVDEAQAFFRLPWVGTDTFYTCRKFFGVADGAYLYTGDGKTLEREIPRAESYDRMGFVLGRYERSAVEFYVESSENNECFENMPLMRMSKLTENLMRAIDYDGVSSRRRDNFEFLHNGLSEYNLLTNLRVLDGSFMYPLLVKDSGDIRLALAAEGVFVPTLWPNCVADMSETNSVAYKYSKNILPLPVDQRYGLDEMKLMLERLLACLL